MTQLTSRRFRALAVIVPAALAASALHAADGTWTSTSGGNWSDTTKWLGTTPADGAGFTANFTSNIAADSTITLDSARTIGSLVFSDNGASGSQWTVGGTNTLTLTNGGGVTVQALTPAVVSVPLAGTNAVTKTGSALLTLTGTNTLAGGFTISAGTVRVTSNSALGSSTNAVTIASTGATLDLAGGLSLPSGQAIRMGGTGATVNYGAVRLTSGDTTVAAPITLDENAVVHVSPGAILRLSGNINDEAHRHEIDLRGGGDLVVSGNNIHSTINEGSFRVYDGSRATFTSLQAFGDTTANIDVYNGTFRISQGFSWNNWQWFRPRAASISQAVLDISTGATVVMESGSAGTNAARDALIDTTGNTNGIGARGFTKVGGGTLTIAKAQMVEWTSGVFYGLTNGSTVAVNEGRIRLAHNDSLWLATAQANSDGTLEITTGTSINNNLTVNPGGALWINGRSQGDITFNGGVVGGSGTAFDSLTFGTSATIAPGAEGIGRLTFGSLTLGYAQTFASGGTYEFEINNATGTVGSNWDFAVMNGYTGTNRVDSLVVSATEAAKFTVKVLGLSGSTPGAIANWNNRNSYRWWIASTDGVANFASNKFGVDSSLFETYNDLGGGSFSVVKGTGGTVNEVYLVFTPVPLPSSLGMFFPLLAPVLLRRRKRA